MNSHYITQSKPSSNATSNVALQLVLSMPHQHVLSQIQQIHLRLQSMQHAVFLNQLIVDMQVGSRCAYDVIKDVLTSNHLSPTVCHWLIQQLSQVEKPSPTTPLSFWQRQDSDHATSQMMMTFVLTTSRALTLEPNGTLPSGVYGILHPSADMWHDLEDNNLVFKDLFLAKYGLDRRPMFLGRMEINQTSCDKKNEATDKDQHKDKDQAHSTYTLAPSHPNMRIHVTTDSTLWDTFARKVIAVAQIERSRGTLTDVLSAVFVVRVADMTVYHDVGLPNCPCPRHWVLVEVLRGNEHISL